jgi:hypothetical protein
MAILPVAEEIRELEMRLLDPAVRRSPERLEDLLADEFVELGSSGRTYDKRGIIASLAQESPVEVSIRDFRVCELGPAVALATYRARAERAGEVLFSHRSSIWVRRRGRWRIRFHQGTPARDGEDA